MAGKYNPELLRYLFPNLSEEDRQISGEGDLPVIEEEAVSAADDTDTTQSPVYFDEAGLKDAEDQSRAMGLVGALTDALSTGVQAMTGAPKSNMGQMIAQSAKDSLSSYDRRQKLLYNYLLEKRRQKSANELAEYRKKRLEQGERQEEFQNMYKMDLLNRAKEEAGYKRKKEQASYEKPAAEAMAKKVGDAISIANNLDSQIAIMESEPDERKKVQHGKNILKLVNSASTAAPDVVGAEESKRIGNQLEFAYGNLGSDNPTRFGRDLPGFIDSVKNLSNGLKKAARLNQKQFENMSGGKSSLTVPPSVYSKAQEAGIQRIMKKNPKATREQVIQQLEKEGKL